MTSRVLASDEMIRSGSVILLLLLLLGGCAVRGPAVSMLADSRANLLLADRPDELILAQELAGRSDWPAVSRGYVFDEVFTATRVIVDDQSFFDPLGGIHINVGESVQTQTTVR